ncbi:MAG: hypothetical protein HOP08_10760 [Cyclobacteriaceae bacterium]|nr:hypothetical protein [Cyclobacteriaceae bacterium]
MKVFITCLFILFTSTSTAQVKNNSINARLRLILDEAALNSSTDNASVEWSCINKELTNKCLVYHNDQWFDFTVPKPGTYFLNVSSQECREKKGVQAVIIEGNPCEIKTYKILKCLSQIRQDDVFIRLDSLKPQITYLVNIDGFLGDFCDFKIQLSSRADGQPLETKRPASRKDQQRSIVRFEWTVSGERIEDIQKFKVYRRKSTSIKSVLVSEQYSMRNAYGIPQLKYQLVDTLDSEGLFTYNIYSVQNENLVLRLLETTEVNFTKPAVRQKSTSERSIHLTLNYAENSPFTIIVFNPKTQEKLLTIKQIYTQSIHKDFEIDVGEFLNNGVNRFLLLLFDDDSGKNKELYYYRDQNGRFVKE